MHFFLNRILAKPGTLEELVGSPSWESHVVIPITSLKTMLRVRFPATEEEVGCCIGIFII